MHLIKRLAVCLCVVGLVSFAAGLWSGPARSAQRERKVKIREFKGAPVEVVAVRNLNNGDAWLRDLEIEVKNVSDKPVYYISLVLEFPDIPTAPPTPRADGTTPSRVVAGFKLRYGTRRLVDLSEPATAEDIFLRPDETYTFRVPAPEVEGFGHMKQARGFGDEATLRINLDVATVSFGDGSGYIAGRMQKRALKSKPKAGPPPAVSGGAGPTGVGCSRASVSDALFLSVSDALFLRAGWPGPPLSFAPRPKKASPQLNWCTGGCDKYYIVESDPNTYCINESNGICYTDQAYIGSGDLLCSKYREVEMFCGIVRCPDYEIDPEATAQCEQPCPDRDGDGFTPESCGGTDCNDNPGVGGDYYPGRPLGPCGGMYPGPQDKNCNGDDDYYERGCPSPVVVDVAGDGFALTGNAGGVAFDLDGDGARERLSWTKAGSDDAWLALDRDGDGVISTGRELFGNHTPQPAPPPGEYRNGFLALAEFDKPGNGGNGDGLIDRRDSIYPSLRLWQDTNHDGLSAATELRPLPALDVTALSLDYKVSKRTDAHGNAFRYRAKVSDAKGARVNRWAWDVFLVPAL